MTKLHPKNRGERRRLKAKHEALDRADAINRRSQFEALEQKEAIDALRQQVLEEGKDD